jgi:hypothetical protein
MDDVACHTLGGKQLRCTPSNQYAPSYWQCVTQTPVCARSQVHCMPVHNARQGGAKEQCCLGLILQCHICMKRALTDCVGMPKHDARRFDAAATNSTARSSSWVLTKTRASDVIRGLPPASMSHNRAHAHLPGSAKSSNPAAKLLLVTKHKPFWMEQTTEPGFRASPSRASAPCQTLRSPHHWLSVSGM